jgi:hypothetical protein
MALPPNGNGTDRGDLLQELLDAGAITLDSFTANPQTVAPCGGPPVTLTWKLRDIRTVYPIIRIFAVSFHR